jgi:hypothetical protein
VLLPPPTIVQSCRHIVLSMRLRTWPPHTMILRQRFCTRVPEGEFSSVGVEVLCTKGVETTCLDSLIARIRGRQGLSVRGVDRLF